MQQFPKTIILRHRRENLKKCSLRGLESRADFQFYRYPTDPLPDLKDYILLTLKAPPLTKADDSNGLFVLDSTWRYADPMLRSIPAKETMIERSLPADFRTAYPRRQDDCSDPERGLASIEAIFAAYVVLGRDPAGLLEGYYWREAFLEKNKVLLDFYDYKFYY